MRTSTESPNITLKERNITFDSDGNILAGTLTLPPEEGPHPAALLIAGSGPLDRDGNHKRMKLYVSRDLARLLADNGWASLRFDKRGIGESSGEYLSTGFFDELADIEAALEALMLHDEVGHVVLIGHSAGAIQAAELASRRADLAGAVLLAASAKDGDETLRWQTLQLQDVLLPRPIKALLKLFGTSVVKQQAKAVARLKQSTRDVERIQLVRTNAKWMREYIGYDPLPAIKGAIIPSVAITGSKDVQVDPADIATIAAQAPSTTVAQVIEDVDHILRHEPGKSNPRLYRKQTEKPLDTRVWDAIQTWLDELTAA